MGITTRAEFMQLMKEEQQWCISIYMPAHRTGTAAQQDPIRLKNLLSEAAQHLADRGLGRREVEEALDPARQLLQDSNFWQHQSDGLAVFLYPNRFRRFSLPLSFEELVVVDDHFYTKPLLPLFTGDGRFYILALSQNDVRLLVGTRHSVSEVDIGAIGGGLAENLPSSDHQTSVQSHTSGSAGGLSKSGSRTFHGQGGGSDEDSKSELLRYLRLVSDGLSTFLHGDQVPLVLAGVQYLLPIYKEANTFPTLMDTVIEGNPDELRLDELHKSAWEIVEPLFEAAQTRAVGQYHQLAGQASERVADTLDKIVPAACQGRVETLFVATGVQQWGVFDPITNRADLHEQMEPGDEHLLDLAAVQTFSQGGVVYAVDADSVPGGTNAAAVLRY